MSELKDSILEIPKLIKALKEKFSTEAPKAKTLVAGEKTFSYTGEELILGSEVMEGDKPCPDGEYTTEMFVFTVKDGKVIDIKVKEEKPVEQDYSKVIAELTAEMKKEAEAVASNNKTYFDSEIKKIQESFTAEITGIKAASAEQTKSLKDIVTLVETLSNAPAFKSDFKKKDGAPATTKSLMEQAADLSKKVFK